MNAPTMSDVRPSFKAANQPVLDQSAAEFGPDFTKTPTDEKPPKTTRQTRVKAQQPVQPKQSPFAKLGQNKKVRSPVRKLTREVPSPEELSDLEKLIIRYRRVGKIAEPFHPKFAMAVTEQAEDCALAWFELAEQNDTVRRWILGVLEGGAWGGVIAAHTPLFMAVIPESVLEKFFLGVMGTFNRKAQPEEDNDLFGPNGMYQP